MTMSLAALEEIVMGNRAAAAVCWSQQPQSPHLEPGAQTAGGKVEPLSLTSTACCRDGGAPAQTYQPSVAVMSPPAAPPCW